MTSLVVAGFVGAATGAIGAEAGLAVLGLGDPRRSRGARCSTGPTPRAPLRHGPVACGVRARAWSSRFLITALTFINFGVDLLSNPHLRED